MSAADLSAIIGKSSWSREVVVWIGSEVGLGRLTEGTTTASLDILDLMPVADDVPADDEGRTQLLCTRLRAQLREIRESAPGRLILLVKSAFLLARYKVGLRALFDRFAGSRTMAILVIPAEMSEANLPSHLEKDVQLRRGEVVDYLRDCLADPRNPKRVFRERL